MKATVRSTHFDVEVGGQASYLPTIRQTLIGIRGGIGRQLPLSQRLEVQLGLKAEYGLNQLRSEQNQLSLHPVLVGGGSRLHPRLSHP